ncbi:MAG: tetratricopeptide repeat protein [Parahaliea sp.]
MTGRIFSLLLALAVCSLPAAGADAPGPDFVGSQHCKSCHAGQFEDWRGSDHDLAMQPASADTVLGDFDNAEFSYGGLTSRFFRRDGQYFVRTDGEDGKLTDFPVPFVFGVYPLQQYLIPLSRGRLQALSIAWDSRPASAGGQRWFHLYPDEVIRHDDPLHWTGPYQNWNTRCAECHSTDLHKNYDAASRHFDTRYAEIDVACEACHGPGRRHSELALASRLGEAVHGGFPISLAQRGEWAFANGSDIAQRRSPVAKDTQLDTCGRCHARRGTLGDYHYGRPLADTHRLALPRAPEYYHDGQIRDEDYVYGSFLQSKMYQAGVVCSNCHEPHSLKLRAPGNGVCAQCHKPAVFDSSAHHHHPTGSSGAQCANCHMPETTYMVVDPRRDHSLRVPRPDLSLMLGTPNACNGCHSDQSADWALNTLRDWGVRFRDTGSHPARAFAALAAGDSRAVPRLAQLAQDSSAAPIWRATAVEAIGQAGARETPEIARQLLVSSSPLLRTSAVNSLAALPPAQRYLALRPLVKDEVTSVRLAVAEALAPVPLAQLRSQDAQDLQTLFNEYRAIAREHADMPGMNLQLGVFLGNRGDLPAAEAAYREALALNPQQVSARLNLADLLRVQQREGEAREQLQQALAVAPEHGPTLFALGLLETRAGNSEAALDYLGRAAAVESQGTRQRYVYAVALHDLGQPERALLELEKLLRHAPQDTEVLLALVNYSAGQGKLQAARRYARRLQASEPNNPAYRQLLQRLEGQ